jgi:hypothetical protein
MVYTRSVQSNEGRSVLCAWLAALHCGALAMKR